MVQVIWRHRRPGGARGHRLGLGGLSAPGVEAVAAALSYRETGDPFSGVADGRPRGWPSSSALILRKSPKGERLYAARGFRPRERVLELEPVTWRPERDPETVEHPFGGHLFHPVLAKAAHSCEPNCRVDFGGRALVACRPIPAGEPITTDYLSTDRRISRPFDCSCGSPRCRGRIG